MPVRVVVRGGATGRGVVRVATLAKRCAAASGFIGSYTIRVKAMSRQLLVLRHAKSAWDTDAATDFERPLAKRGKKDAPRMGQWLREYELVPDHVVCSPAERARQTAVAVCKQLGLDKKTIHWDEHIYLGTTEALLQVLGDCPPAAGRVMIVGHNPGLEDLVEYLCGAVDAPVDGKLLPTATVAHLEMPDAWDTLAGGSARLMSITRPRSLEE